MGKWSMYRRRGRGAITPEPVVLLESAAAPTGYNTIGASNPYQYFSTGDGFVPPVDWEVTGIDIWLRRSGAPAGDVRGIIWDDAAGIHGLPRVLSGAMVPKLSVSLTGAWVHFEASPSLLGAGNRYWPGLFATLEITIPKVEWGFAPSAGAVTIRQSANEVAWVQSGVGNLSLYRLWGRLA
jgi:hypothetical protein